MKEQFNLLKKAVQECNDSAMNVILELLEDYNNGLSSYFKTREVTRGFMDAIDLTFTANVFKKRFGDDVFKNMAMQQLMIDLNTLARSTWYFEREDGKILTGQTLYENRAVYMASITVREPVYSSESDKELAEEINEINESGGILFKNHHHPFPPEAPQPISTKEVGVEISGEEKVSTINEMLSLIEFHAIVNQKLLLS